MTEDERERLLALGTDLGRVWSAATTTDRDRKQLLRTLIEEVVIDVVREQRRAMLTLRWRGGAITELAVALPKPQPAIRTDEDTIELLSRLAVHYDDGKIAGILNRQGRRSATGERFTAIIVGGLRRYRNIPAYKPPAEPPDGELLPVGKAADELGVAASTLHRWLGAGFIRGEQDTPGAPWRIRVNDQLRALFVNDAPPATSRSSTRCEPSASPARRCYSVSGQACDEQSTHKLSSQDGSFVQVGCVSTGQGCVYVIFRRSPEATKFAVVVQRTRTRSSPAFT